MGRTRYESARIFIDGMNSRFPKGQLPLDEFKRQMMLHIGGDYEKTIKPYIKLMETVEILRQHPTLPNTVQWVTKTDPYGGGEWPS